jgi:phage gp45-like
MDRRGRALMLARLASAIRSLVTRAKVANAAIGPRTLLQISGLNSEAKTTVELLLPPGYSARPAAGADVVVLQVLGSRDHLVALGGDAAGQDAIADLSPGEFGLRQGDTTLVFRNTGTLEVTAPTVRITGDLHVTGDVVGGFGGGDQVGLLTHNHGNVQTGGDNTSAPNPGT